MLALLMGIGTAFATKLNKHKENQTEITYYAISDGGGNYHWTTVEPSDPLQWECRSSGVTGTFCYVVVWDGYVPQSNTPIPYSHTGLQGGNGTVWYPIN